MEIREITANDEESYKRIISRSFERGREVTFPVDTLGDPKNPRFGAYENGRLQAALRMLDFQMFFGEDQRPCGGIAGVASEPAARGRGYAGALLRHSLAAMRDAGQYLSSLWPFDFRFYQRYGWEWTGVARNVKMPLRLLSSDPEAAYVESVDENRAEALNPIYEAYVKRYNGALVRGQKRWDSALRAWSGRAPAVYVYRRDGAAEGYAIVRYADKDEAIQVSDFAALSARAYRGLLGLLHHHGMTVEKVEWHAPSDDPFWSILAHWDVETSLHPCGMSRIVDLPAALRAQTQDPSTRGPIVIAVHDEHAGWNAGTWRIEIEDGRVDVGKADSEPGVSIDIRALTQAYWGTPSLDDLRRADRLRVHSESDYRLLSALLPARTAWLADDF